MQPVPAIRLARQDDVESLLDLYAHLSPGDARCSADLARDNVAKLAAFPGSGILIGEVDGLLVVTCTLIVIPNLTRGGAPYGLIENVVTHPQHRRRGFGKLVLDSAVARAWDHGCYKVMLSTGSLQEKTRAFYESAGFAQSRLGFQKRRIAPRAE